MKNMVSFTLVIGLLLVASGAVMANNYFAEPEAATEDSAELDQDDYGDMPGSCPYAQEGGCNKDTCPRNCGGGCGVSSCGCGR